MRGGLFGSLCFLAFLLSSGTKGQNVLNSPDLQGSQGATAAGPELNKDRTSVQVDGEGEDRSSASAFAKAEIGNYGNSGRPNWSVPTLVSHTYTQGNAEASANAQAGNTAGNYHGYGYPSSNAAAQANANAFANAGGGSPYGYSGFRSGDAQDESELLLDNQAVAENPAERNDLDANDASEGDEGRMGGFGNYGVFSGATSRIVPQNEIIQPDLIPGGLNLIQCTQENQIHNIWSPKLQCLVCVCVRNGWALSPMCVSCSSCARRPVPRPLPPPSPVPIIPLPPAPIIPPPLPIIPESQVSCSPLPTNTPFENPLNPCQTCICQNIVNAFGKEDVQINCEQNPSCDTSQNIHERKRRDKQQTIQIWRKLTNNNWTRHKPNIFVTVTPPGYIPIPPPQEPLQPVPMPLCESLPVNVSFPHPTEICTICKCVVEVTPYLVPERKMICQPDLECVQPTPPPPPPVPDFPIIPYPTPPPPTPVPPIIPSTEITPVPWPPIVAPMPRPRSPLPGPPPHDTCKPYPPNTPFQHPWDECQICMCSEIYGNNVVNIEVNCYTKKSCCIEPPIPEPLPAIPYRPVPSPSPIGNLIFIEPECRYKAPNQPYVEDCNICVCEVIYQYVYTKCTPQPNCGQLTPYGQIGGSADASAGAIAQAIGTGSSSASAFSNAVTGELYNTPIGGNQYPYIGGALPPSSYSSADASANAQSSTMNLSPYSNSYPYAAGESNAQAGNVLYPYGNSYPYSLGESNAQAQAEAYANAQSGNVNLSPYSSLYPYSAGQSSAQAQAEALANAQSSLMSPYGTYPYYAGGQSSAQAQAEANAQSQTYGSPYGSFLGGSQAAAQAQAEASANAQSSLISPYGTNPYYAGGQSSAQAQAEANAQSQTYGSPYVNHLGSSQAAAQGQAEAITGSQMYPSLYPFPTTNIEQLYQPGVNGWDVTGQSQAMASAQADASSQGGSSASATAQSLAQAAAMSGRPLIKSGREDDDTSHSSEE